MTVFLAPLFVILVALGFSGRIVYLKANGRPVSGSLSTARHAAWSAAGFSIALACFQAAR